MIAVEITSLSLTGIGLAFAAGLLSFVSPCVLPLLPVYLSFISGVGVEDLGRQPRAACWGRHCSSSPASRSSSC